MLREQRLVEKVDLWLPAGFAAAFALHGQRFAEESAACFVVKDAGDDPDVTHGVEVHAQVSLVDSPAPPIVIEGGAGIGRVTKPGTGGAGGGMGDQSGPPADDPGGGRLGIP